MRSPLGISLGMALALAPVVARAELPVVARLDYVRGPGAETCPADASTLRAHVAALLGYDPFARGDAPERVVVVVSAGKDRAWSARVERYNAAGALTYGPETFPDPPLQGDCGALVSPLAAYLRGLVLRAGPPPAAPVPSPPPAPRAPPPEPAKAPEPPSVPNAAHTTARALAIVSYSVGAVLLGFGIGFTVDEQSKTNSAQTLSGQVLRSGGTTGCASGSVSGASCDGVLRAWQSRDSALNARNGFLGGAGASMAIGAIATVFAVNLPTMVKGQSQTQVTIRPGGLVFSGTF
jgi:hypothetical protein